MAGLPYFGTIGPNGFTELVNALQESAADEWKARAAVDAILADTSRASSPETNRVPSPGELRVWVEAQSPTLDEDKPAGVFCGHCDNGWVRMNRVYRGMTYGYAGRCVCQGGKCSPREGER
jgi:hypothetical protein